MPPIPSPTLLVGDFNLEPVSKEYEQLVGPIDHEYGRITRIDSLVDIWTGLGHTPDGPETKPCPANKPRNTDTRIDYCFTTTDLAEKAVSMLVDQSAQGSDHQQITTEFKA